MEILDPDLWNDDGTPKRPTEDYMQRLKEAQDMEALMEGLAEKRAAEAAEAARQFKAMLAPTVGDIVHFWDDEAARCRAAMVMETPPGTGVELRVHVPHESFQDWCADHDEDRAPNTWHWPESR